MTSDRKIKVSFTLNQQGEPVDVNDHQRTEANTLVEEVSPSSLCAFWVLIRSLCSWPIRP